MQKISDNFTFYTAGIARGTRKEQLRHFSEAMHDSLPETTAEDWYEVFKRLRVVISKSRQRRKVVFLDELPWMDTQKSEFVKALDLFWNEWGSTRNDLLLIVCGSEASWMVKNILKKPWRTSQSLDMQATLESFQSQRDKTVPAGQRYRLDG